MPDDNHQALRDVAFNPEIENVHAEYYVSRYALHRKTLSRSARDAVWASIQASGKDAGDRRYWSSVVFVRLTATCNSLLQLCPLSLNDILSNWDFSSVASLARNLFEGYLLFRYISEPTIGDEWRARLHIMQLCDCMSRIRLFQQLNSSIEAAKFHPAADDLKFRLEQNPFFLSLDVKLQKQLIQGTRASIYTSRELSVRAEIDQTVWGYFELFSSHAHNFPLSFYRLEEQGRTGVANETDQSYISFAMEFATKILEEAIRVFKQDFADLVSFTATDSSVEMLLRKRMRSASAPGMNRSQKRAIERQRKK